MRLDRCWFTECHAAGAMVDLDGSHPRSLCPKHANGIRIALDQPGTYRVSWGHSKAEQIATRQERLPEAEAWAVDALERFETYGPPRERDEVPDDLWLGEDPEYLRLESQADGARAIVEGIRDGIGELGRRAWDHPIVRVEVATR